MAEEFVNMFLNPNFQFVLYSICLTIASFQFGKSIGEIKSLRDDFKSLDYDRLKEENEVLSHALEIKQKRRR